MRRPTSTDALFTIFAVLGALVVAAASPLLAISELTVLFQGEARREETVRTHWERADAALGTKGALVAYYATAASMLVGLLLWGTAGGVELVNADASGWGRWFALSLVMVCAVGGWAAADTLMTVRALADEK